jgi:hypothetical protein
MTQQTGGWVVKSDENVISERAVRVVAQVRRLVFRDPVSII